MNILIALLSLGLILLCFFTLLVVMVQKPKGDGGMGAALGGGAMEAALGAETGSLLTKITRTSVISFFVLTFILYLINIASNKRIDQEASENLLSEIAAESAAGANSTEATADSALQQILRLGEGSAGAVATETEAVAEDVVDQVEGAKAEAEKATNP